MWNSKHFHGSAWKSECSESGAGWFLEDTPCRESLHVAMSAWTESALWARIHHPAQLLVGAVGYTLCTSGVYSGLVRVWFCVYWISLSSWSGPVPVKGGFAVHLEAAVQEVHMWVCFWSKLERQDGPWLVYGLTELPLTIQNVSIITKFKCLIPDSLGSLWIVC